MRIVRRHVYKKEQDVLIAEVSEEASAKLICRLLNLSANLDDVNKYYYQVVTDEFKLREE